MTTATIDLNLVDLVEQYTQLRKVSGREYAGPCPSCGGTDRLHVVDDPAGAWWFCRQCFPADNGKRHDLPAFQALVGDRPAQAPRAPAPRAHTSTTAASLTQAQAVELVDRGVRRLEVDDLALAYLAQRGIKTSTARAWWLGSSLVWNRDARGDLPAILLPWVMGDNVTGVKYRFLSGTQRYTSRKVEGAGSFTDHVFGRQMYGGAYDVLLVVEGELNAVSVWQAARGLGWRHLDVISVGAQDGIRARALADVVCDFRRIVLWADDAKVVTSGRQAAPRATMLQSPIIDGVKWDANAQLVAGILNEFLITIMEGI